jgi:microcystin-dependent protein
VNIIHKDLKNKHIMENYLGEIRLFPYNRIPNGWLVCNGQTLPINQNQALYALIGTKFAGGDGSTTFALPNLNGRVIVGTGQNGSTTYGLGETGGLENVTLTLNQLPAHNHTINVNVSYDLALPSTNFLGNPNVQTSSTQKQKNTGNVNLYTTVTPTNPVNLAADSVANLNATAPHENRMPFLAMVYCIAKTGIWPSRQ